MIFGNLLAFIAIISSIAVITVRNPVSAVLWLIGVFVTTAIYLINSGLIFIGLSYIIVYVGAIAVLFLFVVIILNIKALQTIQNNNSELTTNESYNVTDIQNTDMINEVNNTSIVVHVINNNNNKSSIIRPIKNSLPIAILLTIIFVIGITNYAPSTLPLSLIDNINNIFMNGSMISNDLSQYNLLVFQTLNPSISYDMIIQVQILGLTLYTEGSIWLILTSILLLLAILAPIALCMESIVKNSNH